MPQKAQQSAVRSRSLSEIAAAIPVTRMVLLANAWMLPASLIGLRSCVDKQSIAAGSGLALQPFHKAVHNAFFARLVEGDGELVAVDGHHVAIAEFLVKHAVAHHE